MCDIEKNEEVNICCILKLYINLLKSMTIIDGLD